MGYEFSPQLDAPLKKRSGEIVVPPSSLLTGLVAFYKLGEATGASRLDSTANALHLAEVGAGDVTQVAGKIGNAASFASAASTILEKVSALLNPGDTAFTWAFWFKSVDTNAVEIPVAASDSTSGPRSGCVSEHLYFDMLNGGAAVGAITHSQVLADDTWYHVRCYHDPVANEVGVSINNGAVQTAATSAAGAISSSDVFHIGGSNGALILNGIVDSVGVWSRLLTDDECADLYNGGDGLEWPFTIGEL